MLEGLAPKQMIAYTDARGTLLKDEHGTGLGFGFGRSIPFAPETLMRLYPTQAMGWIAKAASAPVPR